MPTGLLMGLGLTLLAGLLAGNCMTPMKFSRRWRWEKHMARLQRRFAIGPALGAGTAAVR